ncbi:hypothetical protein ACFLWN_04505 [Chloroflexota bacterium]
MARNKKHMLIWLVATFTLLTLIPLGCTMAQAQEAVTIAESAPLTGATIVLSSTEWEIGDALTDKTIKGSGFAPNEAVDFFIVNAFGEFSFGIGTGERYTGEPWETNASGAFQRVWSKGDRIPPFFDPGIYTFQAKGRESGTIATVPLELVEGS